MIKIQEGRKPTLVVSGSTRILLIPRRKYQFLVSIFNSSDLFLVYEDEKRVIVSDGIKAKVLSRDVIYGYSGLPSFL